MLLLRSSPRSILTPPRRCLLSSSGHRPPSPSDEDKDDPHPSSGRRRSLLYDADQIFSILQQDSLGFEARTALNDLRPNLTASVVHIVLRRSHSSITTTNKSRSAKLAFKFFAWASNQPHYSHPTHIYNLTMKILADADELKNIFSNKSCLHRLRRWHPKPTQIPPLMKCSSTNEKIKVSTSPLTPPSSLCQL
ncbi:hypothetical protein IHE45_13G071300 [Dioscorea alata]|uniref:Uncharacterized protein n=2 Tax=Dioscorea alata TaxID=55571 RepID=A0ACB7UZ73_DIOAL|nr:hypothetical protein IHE45_13G071300 [Dioscorea alata]KAH7666006.1 hypothetical protein IHE45_13G071300 [Dioscorea alata]